MRERIVEEFNVGLARAQLVTTYEAPLWRDPIAVAILVLVVLLLSGCGAFDRQVEYKPYPVPTPVPVPCAAQLPPEPAWASAGVRKTDDIDVKVDGVLAERRQRKGYEEKLRAAVAGCQ